MGDIDNGVVDCANWTPQLVAREVQRACEANGKSYFIPCSTMGGPESSYPGVYEEITKSIDIMSEKMFGKTQVWSESDLKEQSTVLSI
jgi:hypothetical protein